MRTESLSAFVVPQWQAGWLAAFPRGMMSPDDWKALLGLVCQVRPRTFVEFGVRDGKTAAMLLGMLPSLEHYCGIDLPPGMLPRNPGQRREPPAVPGEFALADRRFALVLADSLEISPHFLGKQADAILIDGGHDLETVRHDTEVAMALAPRLVVWHDVAPSRPGVWEATQAFIGPDGVGVTRVDGTMIGYWRQG